MNVVFENDGLNESQPAGSIPDFEPDLLTLEDLGADTPFEPECLPRAEGVL